MNVTKYFSGWHHDTLGVFHIRHAITVVPSSVGPPIFYSNIRKQVVVHITFVNEYFHTVHTDSCIQAFYWPSDWAVKAEIKINRDYIFVCIRVSFVGHCSRFQRMRLRSDVCAVLSVLPELRPQNTQISGKFVQHYCTSRRQFILHG